MSGAEALAAVGLASNVLQFVDFTFKLCAQIKEYASSASGLPKELSQQAVQLSALLNLLKGLSQQSDGPKLGTGVLEECQSQAQKLSDLLESLRGGGDKSRWRTARVALRSLKREEQIGKLQSNLDRLVQLLSFHLQVEAKRAADQTGTDVSAILNIQSGQLSILERLENSGNKTTNLASNTTQSEPVWIVPLGRNPKFVGRKKVLEYLEDSLTKKDESMPVAVLHGLGGVGKTQVVLEYIFRTRTPSTAVFWISAISASRFVESYKRVALECRIPGHDNPDADVMQLVRDWLEAQYSPEWLMIVDNVDDRTMFFEQTDDMTTGKCLIEYIPQAEKGSVIYTTRSRDVGIDLASGDEPIELSPMGIDEGLLMLGDGVTRGSTKEDQETLLEELAYLPLAISQATAYMVKRRRSIADYVRLLQNESTRTRVLDHRTLHHGRQDRSSESVTRTWWITFQCLKKEHPRSAELLTMMSLLDRQQIPLALVQDAGEDTFDFEEAIGILECFSLIHLYPYVEVCEEGVIDLLFDGRPDLSAMSSEFCDMHRLVQASTREWLSRPENDKVHIATKTIVSVSKVFPPVNVEDWPLCHILYPHADAVLAYNSTELTVPCGRDGNIGTWNIEHRASLLLKMSRYLRKQGHLAASEHRATLSLEIRRLLFDPDDSEQTMDSMESLAMSISMLGRGAEALEMHRKILEGRERLLGPNHKSTLDSLSQIGFILRSQGECAEAEVHYRRALVLGRMLHEQDPSNTHLMDGVIIALANFADVLNDQGEFEEAQTLLQEALERSQDAHGRDHYRTWNIMASLAISNGHLAKFEEAHALFAEVLAGHRKVFGETHHETLITRRLYTSLLLQQGKYAEAEEESRSLLEYELLANGVGKHTTMSNLGFVLRQQKKYGEAEKIYKHLLELQEQALEKKPSAKAHDRLPGDDLASFRASIAICLKAQGKVDEAKEYQPSWSLPSTTEIDVEEAKKLHERSLDMYNEGRYKEAEETARKELEIRIEHAGLDNDRTQTCLFQIAGALHKQNAHFDSQSFARQVLAYRKRKFGWRNIETYKALGLLAETTREHGKLEEAEGYYRQLLLCIENSGGKFDVESCDARWGLANVLARQRKYPEAEKLFRFNLELQLDDPFSSNPKDIADAYYDLGGVLWLQSRDAEAEACLHSAYDRYVELFGRSDADSTNTLAFLAEVVAEQGKCRHAEELYLLLGETLALPQSEDEDSGEGSEEDSDGDPDEDPAEDSDEDSDGDQELAYEGGNGYESTLVIS